MRPGQSPLLLKPHRGGVLVDNFGMYRSVQPAQWSTLNRGNILTQNLVFAFDGRRYLDSAGPIQGIPTNVVPVTSRMGIGTTFAGGALGASQIDFGFYQATANLHHSPATWAFFATTTAIFLTDLAAQSDNNVDRGWNIGNYAGNFGGELVRSGGNIRVNISETVPVNSIFSLVYAYDGSENLTGTAVTIYLNGIAGTKVTNAAGAGTTGPMPTQHMFVGQRIFNNPGSHSGNIFCAAIAARTWSAMEAKMFHYNPWQIFA